MKYSLQIAIALEVFGVEGRRVLAAPAASSRCRSNPRSEIVAAHLPLAHSLFLQMTNTNYKYKHIYKLQIQTHIQIQIRNTNTNTNNKYIDRY